MKYKEWLKSKNITIHTIRLREEFKENGVNWLYRVLIQRVINFETFKISFLFHDSINNHNTNKRVTIEDILYCIIQDYPNPESFKDFCAEFGYNTDSIKDFKLYKLCLKQSEKLHKIFTEEEINELNKIMNE